MNKSLFVNLSFFSIIVAIAQPFFPWDTIPAGYKLTINRLAVSTEEDDFAPVIIHDKLIFTSTAYFAKANERSLKHNQRIYFSSIFEAKKTIYPYNFDEHMATAGSHPEASMLFLYMPFDNGDLYSCTYKNNKFSRPQKMPRPINKKNSSEQSIAWKDGSYYFSSDRYGNYDIFYATTFQQKQLEIQPVDKINSPADEVDVRVYKDWVFFSSNRDGKFKPYVFVNDMVKPVLCLPDSFFHHDVRDFLWLDSLFLFSSNVRGNYDIYIGRVKPVVADTINIVANDTLTSETDQQQDTVASHQQNPILPSDKVMTSHEFTKLQKLHRLLDSLGIVYPIRCYVQVGAYYGIRSVEEFKSIFLAFDTSRIFIEKVETQQGLLHRFLLLPSYDNVENAIQRQQIALEQQACSCNKKPSKTDAFVALYDANNRRIGIYFNDRKKEYFLLLTGGQKIQF